MEAWAAAVDAAYNPDRYPIMAAMFRDYADAGLDAALAIVQPTLPNEAEALKGPPMTDQTTDLIQRYAAEIERIIDAGTAADHTWVGLLSAFMQEYAGDPVPAFTDLHAFLDLARFRDRLSVTVANGDGTLTARIEGPVLAADPDPAVGINLLDGEPYVLRNTSGIVWAPVRHATLSRDGQAIATFGQRGCSRDRCDCAEVPPDLMSAMDQILAHLDAMQAEESLRRGLADIAADRVVDLGTFAPSAQEVTSAPQTAPQAEAWQGGGGEAERAVAREIWRWYVGPSTDAFDQDKHAYAYDIEKAVGAAQDALAAAEPHIRAKIAAEIEQRYLGADFGRNPVTGADSPDSHLHAAHDEALNLAARIARGEQP